METDWEVVEPRPGLAGVWDRLVGPGASDAELALEAGAMLAGAILVPALAVLQKLDWSPLQLVVAALLALDLFGGAVVNATAAAKRWYHRPGEGFRQHFGFVLIHVHPLVVAWLFADGDWVFGLVAYGYLLLASLVVLRAPLYLRRPLAMLLYMGGFMLSLYVLGPVPGMAWFLPVFYLKLLVSHLLPETPYRAAD